jgi:cobalt-zinc-cadmium efflux system outer membrane protein
VLTPALRCRRFVRLALVLGPIAFLAGCTASLAHDHAYVTTQVAHRAGHPAGPGPEQRAAEIPGSVAMADGLSMGDAIAIALWNNPNFQEVLAELGVSRADLVQAGLLSNPVLSVLFPMGPKQLEFAAKLPLEVLWLRPRRLAVARLGAERIAEGLVERGLDLIQTVSAAWIDAYFTTEHVALAAEDARISLTLAELADVRLAAGEVSELDATTARVTALLARERARRVAGDLDLARVRLDALLGIRALDASVAFEAPPAVDGLDPDLERLTEIALAARPDMRAAEIAIEEAGKRVRLSRWEILAVSFGVDANEKGRRGFEIGPAADVGIPIFNRNQGAIARGEAEVVRALRHYVALENRIAFEVADAHSRLATAQMRASILRESTVPEIETAVHRAELAYAAGDASMVLVLQTSAQLLAVRGQQLDARADVARAVVQLERSIGTRVDETVLVHPLHP